MHGTFTHNVEVIVVNIGFVGRMSIVLFALVSDQVAIHLHHVGISEGQLCPPTGDLPRRGQVISNRGRLLVVHYWWQPGDKR